MTDPHGTRRHFLAGLPAILSSPWLVGAPGPSDLKIGQLRLGSEWNPRPTGLRRLLWEVTQRTSIEVHLEPTPVDPTSSALFRHPLLYWSGAGEVPELSDDVVKRLRRHLTYGGMLIIDSADANPGGPFDTGVRRVMNRVLPRSPLERIDPQHVMYKSFYLVTTQSGRTLRLPYLEGAAIEKRYAVVYAQNDLAGAWARDAFGRWEYEVSPGGQRQREMTFRLGINLVMYALCLDYKDDLVHMPFIQKRRR
ncbi:MAG: DUF4159 domain-containing protein [Myxococcota bacterium]